MTRLIILFSLLSLLSCTERPTNEKEVYLFSYFKGRGEDGLHLAYSMDGYEWKALNNDQTYLLPKLSKDSLMRDPCIIQGPDGLFHMVWTVSWEERGIGYVSSKDLIQWSEQQFIPVMMHEPGAKNCWAPEIFYDEVQQQYLIFWSTTIEGRFEETADRAERDWNHRIYYCTTKDFTSFSPTKLFLDPGFNVIDATIMKDKDRYVMIVKDETKFPEAQKNLHVLISKNLYNWDVSVSGSISDNWVEGPTMIQKDDQFMIFFDRYREHQMGAVASSDLESWEDVSQLVSFPDGVRHGTAFRAGESVLKGLKKSETQINE